MLSQILIVGSSTRYRPLFAALRDQGIKAEQVPTANEALMALTLKSYSAVIIDWDLPFLGRLEALEQIFKMRPNLPVVALGNGSVAPSRSYSKSGMVMEHLTISGDTEIDMVRLLGSLRQLVPELGTRVSPGRELLWIETHNKKMKEVLSLVDIIKDEPGSVLIQGENGTGKEVIAWLLHYSGRRHTTPFVAINCAAIPETLLESELFGHEKGSFTGAAEKRIGKFELAHKGTAFLDEIGDMPMNTQAKILRALETGMIERVGGHEKIPVDLRIVAASNQNLVEQIEKGSFRQDLYYRINTFTLSLPALRDRREDLPALAQHFLDLIVARRGGGSRKVLSRSAERMLLGHDWPGNVRELRNAMERAAVLTAGGVIEAEVLPEDVRGKRDHAIGPMEQPQRAIALERSQSPIVSLEELERKAILEALSQLRNNATEAAKRLGISKATLYRKLKRYGISRQVVVWN
ncbi:MAG: sigma-54-dependent Fis family transcriptional regulator [Deltaproteobacteria bacterium]|nr:sigma-54-dependent Fis family transcriptional regulator [Deltaproteobacteria bacterium]